MARPAKLTPKAKRFCEAYVRLGGNGTRAAIMAGYAEAGAHVEAHRLLRKPLILEAIKEEVERTLRANVALGSSVLADLAENAKSESVKFQAAVALLDRGGFQLKHLSEHHHIIEDRRTDAELRAMAQELAARLNLRDDAGSRAKLIEARADDVGKIAENRQISGLPVTKCGYTEDVE